MDLHRRTLHKDGLGNGEEKRWEEDLNEEKEEGEGEGEGEGGEGEGEGEGWGGEGDKVGEGRGVWYDETSEEEDRNKVRTRRTTKEVALGYVCHLLFLCFYIYVHVYDSTTEKNCPTPGRYFPGADRHGGRWMFLTYVNLWIQFLYFFLAFFTDIMPPSEAKGFFQRLTDLAFTTIAFPFSAFVFIAFWSIYAIDREFIYPTFLDEYIPFILNHYWHTTILIASLIELIVVFHRHPSSFTAVTISFVISTTYIIWITWLFTKNSKWPYPFMNKMPPPLLLVFFVSSFFCNLGMYYLGRGLTYLRWHERILGLQQQSKVD